jgi:VIT1/CCC1 family predicted Fe2+/Mn2+ transporter
VPLCIASEHCCGYKQANKMKEKELSELTDQELLDEAKKMKSTTLLNAVLIGVMIGVVVYSVVKNSWGFLTLIPLFIAYNCLMHLKKTKQWSSC